MCNNNKDKNNIDWDDKLNEFNQILDNYRNNLQYDCIVPFSGGKDSTFTLLTLVKNFNLKPLAVSFDHGFMRKNLLE